MDNAVAQRQRRRLVPVIARGHARFLADRKTQLCENGALDFGDRELIDGLAGWLGKKAWILHCEPVALFRKNDTPITGGPEPVAQAASACDLCKDRADSDRPSITAFRWYSQLNSRLSGGVRHETDR